MVADGEHDPEFDLIVESTGLDLEQVDIDKPARLIVRLLLLLLFDGNDV